MVMHILDSANIVAKALLDANACSSGPVKVFIYISDADWLVLRHNVDGQTADRQNVEFQIITITCTP
jgi:hypothetical protein